MEVNKQAECMDAADTRKLVLDAIYTIDNTRYERGVLELHFAEIQGHNWYKASRFILSSDTQTTDNGGSMNNETIRKSCIADGDSLEVAEKLQANFSDEISTVFGNDTHTGALFFKANKKNYLAEIKQRDDDKAIKDAAKVAQVSLATAVAKLGTSA